LSWFSSDIVVKASLLGGGIGGIVGTLLYLVAIIDKRKHGLEPTRQQWQWLRWQPSSQWARFSLMIACCAAIALFVLGMLCLGYVAFSHKPLSWPVLNDVIGIGLAVLALGIVFGTMIWWRPPRD
jgi:hypothetical protein